MSQDKRKGFTIVELLVTIAVIALLMGLILPAVQAVREAGRRTQCQARLKDFGTALHEFESSFQTFPSAQRATRESPVRISFHFYSPHVYLLPYFEQKAIAAAIDTRIEQFYVWNPELLNSVARTPIAAFECPSDTAERGGGNNYRFCLGTGPGALLSKLTPGGNGPFEALFHHPSQHIRDGLSYTVAVSEKLKAHGNLSRFEPEGYWYSGIANVIGAVPPLDAMVSLCGSLTGEPAQHQPYAGMTWYLAAYDYTWYNHAVTPNSKIFDCSAQSFSPTAKPGDGVYKASSYHSGGVNCVFLDGHTKFVSNSIHLPIWRALATRAGTEPLSNSDY